METQKFKGDDTELNFEIAGRSPFDVCGAALDSYFASCFNASDFLLAQYDAGRMPFADRVPRSSFVSFIREAIANFRKTGTFEAYIFILESIFGPGTEVQFEIPGNGKLDILVNAAASLEFDWIGREFISGSFEYFDFWTIDGDRITFKGIAGIDSQAKLERLLDELIPIGVFTTVTLSFFILSSFVDSDGNLIVDDLGNQIVFFETGE